MCNNADGEKLLAVITTLHHQAEKRTHSVWPDDTTMSCTQPVYKAFNNGHLGLLELLFSVSTGGMGKINSMADLNIVCQRNVLDFDAETRNSKSLLVTETGNGTYSCVSHFPNNLTSCPSFETSFGSVCTAAIVKLERTRRRPTRCARRVGASN